MYLRRRFSIAEENGKYVLYQETESGVFCCCDESLNSLDNFKSYEEVQEYLLSHKDSILYIL